MRLSAFAFSRRFGEPFRVVVATWLSLLLCGAAYASTALAQPAARGALPAAARAARANRMPIRPSGGRLRNTTQYDWQSLGHDNMHTAYVNDANMNTTIAATLGVGFMTNLLSADLGSPTIAFNPTLNKTIVYAGDQRGNISAFDESSGQTLWTVSLGYNAALYSTPLISSDETSVWIASATNSTLYGINAATGKVNCHLVQKSPIEASPIEGATSNGTLNVYVATTGTATVPGALVAVNESTCAVTYSVNPFKTANSGAVASASYGTDANGRKLVFQGTTHPDDTLYAIDATTGAVVWSYVVDQTGDNDVATAATVSPPGNNGFAQGVVYIIDKNQKAYALNLTTGALIWTYDFGADAGTPSATARSTAALDGNSLVFGMGNGAYALNATSGSKLWHFTDSTHSEAISNPAIVGPPGQEVVAIADLSGAFHALNLANGAELYHYQTGAYITASPAYVNGQFVLTSTDGFLYDFAANGGNSTRPSTTITSPTQGQSEPASSTVAVTGSASDSNGVKAVEVAVQSGGPNGKWFDAATNSYTYGAMTNTVKVSSPGAKTSGWTLSVPVPASGSTFHVYANAVNITQQADVKGAQVSFSVASSATTPTIKATSVYIAPGATFTVKGSGFNPNETVNFIVAGATIGSATATSKGVVSATLTLPTTTPFGAVPLTATGVTSKKSATTAIYVANAWLEAGNTPNHTWFEANDPIFAQLMNPGGNTFLSKAWYFNAGAPVESSPAVYDAMVYFGNDAGTMTAVGTDSAAIIWQYKIASGKPIRSTPAIDPSTGDLTFTADDGVVYVVNAATGAAVGSYTVGGLLTSPTVAKGAIYVGSDNKSVTSLNEKTGKVNWSQKTAGAVHSIPAVDTAGQTVAVGDDSGAITAYLSPSGLQLWQVITTAGKAVTDSPTIVNGSVYVASTDLHFYSINESTGVKNWVYSAGIVITTGAAYDPALNLLYAGLTNGRLDAIDATKGTLTWSTEVPKPYTPSSFVGVSAASSVVFGTDSGGALSVFNSATGGTFNVDLQTGSSLTTAPTVNDGAVFVGANDGGLYAFTPYGGLPIFVPPSIRAAAAVTQQQQPAWAANAFAGPSTARRFAWSGQRDVPLHVDAIRSRTTASADRYHGGPVQTAPRSYLIVWKAPESNSNQTTSRQRSTC